MNVAVAFWAARDRPKTMREYALANRSFGTMVLSMTLFATLMDSSYIGLKSAYGLGVMALLYTSLLSISSFILGWFVHPKMVEFKNKYTLADLMNTMYGPFARIFTVLISTIFSLCMIVSELKSISHLGFLVGTSPATLIIGIGILITLYTATGGIRSVVFTDVLQFIVFFSGLVFFGLSVIRQWGGAHAIWENVSQNQSTNITFLRHPYFGKSFLYAFFWCVFPIILISPAVVQRALLTKKRHLYPMHSFLLE